MNNIDFHIEDKIGFLEISNPPVNSLSVDLVCEFSKIISSLEKDIKMLVITGSGKGFCAGADLKERSQMNDTQTIAVVDSYRKLFEDIENTSCPTIARINGYALGGGLELALSCDFRYAVKDTVLGFPETNLGIIPGAGGTQRLTRLIGVSRAKKWIFTADKFTGEQAFRDNVVDQCFDSNKDMDLYIKNLSKRISKNSQNAVSLAKNAIDYSVKADFPSGMEFEKKQYLKTLNDPLRIKRLKEFKK